MADKERKIKITFDTSGAKKAIDGIKKGLTGLKTVGGKALKAVGSIGSKAFKGIGTAIKGAGIGLLVAGLTGLWEAMKKNQKIMDLFENVVNAIGIAIKPLVDGIASFTEKLSANKDLMDKAKGVIKNLLDVALTPLKLTFYAIKLGIEGAQLIWKKSFLGGKGKDIEGIKKLEESINETKDSIKQVAITAVEASKEFASNIGGVVKGVANVVKEVAIEVKDAYSELSIAGALASGKAATQAKKDLESLAREQEKVQKIAETNAEKQRQIRDDDTKSYKERIKANEDLEQILLDQQKVEESLIQEKIKAQKAINDVEGETEEGRLALLDLNNELLDVESRITGQLSEQKTNRNALVKEQEDAAAELVKIQEEKEATDEAKRLENIANEKAKEQEIVDNKKALAKQSYEALKGIDEQLTQAKIKNLDKQLKSGAISQANYDKQVAKVQEAAEKRSKAIAIAEVVYNTAAAVMGIWKDFPKVDYGIAATIGSIAVAGLGLAQIANIASGSVGGESVGNIASASPSTNEGTTPSTSFSFDSDTTNPSSQTAQKVYVLNKDVQNAEQLDRAIIATGTI